MGYLRVGSSLIWKRSTPGGFNFAVRISKWQELIHVFVQRFVLLLVSNYVQDRSPK